MAGHRSAGLSFPLAAEHDGRCDVGLAGRQRRAATRTLAGNASRTRIDSLMSPSFACRCDRGGHTAAASRTKRSVTERLSHAFFAPERFGLRARGAERRPLFSGSCASLPLALLADALQQDARRLVVRIPRDEPAGEGVGEEGLAEAGGAEERTSRENEGVEPAVAVLEDLPNR